MKKVYLSGAISNNPNYKADFMAADKKLLDAGYAAANPVIFCDGLTDWNDCMRKCMRILSKHTAVAVIDTPHQSRGKDLELEIARALNMEIKTVDEWVKNENKHDNRNRK